MMEKIKEFMESVPMLVVSGVFLLASFVLEKCGVNCPVNPAVVSIVISGIPIVYEAIEALHEEKGIYKITSALLVSMAMIAAIIIGDLFAAGEVAFIMGIGELLEDMTTKRARKGLRKLTELTPKTARIIVDGTERQVPVEEVQVGNIVRINPGETVPVDGIITFGETSLNQSVITGESIPVDLGVGDNVCSGTTNCFGSIDIRVTKTEKESSLQSMIQLVRLAEEQQAPMQRTADRYAGILVPVAFLFAVLTWILTQNVVRGVTVLVVFCPCALVLATPTAIMAAIGQATGKGIIIKSGASLERMGSVDVVCMDKTGTVTEGKPTVVQIIPADGINEDTLVRLAAAAESRSEHPLGKAITSYGLYRCGSLPTCTEFKMIRGRGVITTIVEQRIYVGNEAFMEENGIALPKNALNPSKNDDASAVERTFSEQLLTITEEGKVTVLVADAERLLGVLVLADRIRSEAAKAVEGLLQNGTETMLLTGDRMATAEYVAGTIGIRKVLAGLKPEDKLDWITRLKEEGHVVCMIGDGVNDAPALETADVGIAMGGSGTDIANQAADIALATDDIGKISYLKKLAVETVRTIRFGITLSMTINFVAILLSFFGILTPTTGALVHNLGSVLVVMIAAGLYDRKIA